MATLREFFTTEASDYLAQLAAAVQQLDTGAGDANELHRHVRGLRGSAQMAREDRVYRATLGLEAAARSVAVGVLKWTEDVSSRIRRTLEDVDALVKGGEAEDVADSRLQRALDRWRDVGVDVPPQTRQPAGAAQLSEASKQFRQFAAHEVSGIINEMDVSMEALAADPRTRDPLKAILRRQRALLGSARLQEIGVVAEALRAIEDMTRVIAKLNVPVKEEWMSVFRSAREVLNASVEPLQRGETPGPTPALSKLRTLRQELLDRYGEGEAVSVAGGSPPATAPAPTPTIASHPPAPPPQPARATPAPQVAAPVLPNPAPPAENGAVPIDTLLYRGERALNRALELQPELERLAADNPQAREKVSELFDLIRLAST
jgi:chemotaxis protein histidine kinase CheA